MYISNNSIYCFGQSKNILYKCSRKHKYEKQFYSIANHLTWVLLELCQCWLDSSNMPRTWPDNFRRASVRLPINPATSDLLSTQLPVQLGTFATPTTRSPLRQTSFFSRLALESRSLMYNYWGIRSLRPEENLSTTLQKSRSRTSLLESSSPLMLTFLILNILLLIFYITIFLFLMYLYKKYFYN